MKLQRREKILAGAAAALAVLVGLCFLLFTGDARSYQTLATELDKYNAEIANKQKLLRAAENERQRVAQWRKRSLPADAVLARSLYQNWLRGLATRAHFREIHLSAGDGGGRRDQFARISCVMTCRTNLGDLVQFLHEFYSAGFLHQIRRMGVKLDWNTRDLDVNFTIDGLSLPAAECKDRLPAPDPQRWQLAALSKYREAIVSRNLFSYLQPEPPRQETPAPSPETACVSGVTKVDGAWQVWVEDRVKGTRWKLASGETFSVGKEKGTVQSIHPEGEIIVEVGHHRRMLHLGDKLDGGVELGQGTPGPANEGRNAKQPPQSSS